MCCSVFVPSVLCVPRCVVLAVNQMDSEFTPDLHAAAALRAGTMWQWAGPFVQIVNLLSQHSYSTTPPSDGDTLFHVVGAALMWMIASQVGPLLPAKDKKEKVKGVDNLCVCRV